MDEMTKLWRVRRTVHKMLHDRKYAVAQDDLTRTKDNGANPPEGAPPSVRDLTLRNCALDVTLI